MNLAKITLATAALAFSSLAAHAADISGAGATFPYPIYAKWADAYKKETGIGLNYQSIGSGGGIKQIKAKTVTFGASDMPLTGRGARRVRPGPVPDGHGRHRAGREPRGHQAGRTRCSTARRSPRSSSARSRSGTTRRSPSSTPAPSCPSQAIAVVHRSDGSGTTFNFTNYLSEVEPGLEVEGRHQHRGPVAGRHRRQGQRRRRQQRRQQTKGSIGYVEYAYAKQNKLTYTNMINKAGKSVAPTIEAFQAAAANADWNIAARLRRDPDQPARRQVAGR